MTPDGNPIFGEYEGLQGFIHATGTCGQGFMLGPGLGWTIARMLNNELSDEEKACLKTISLNRDFSSAEKLM